MPCWAFDAGTGIQIRSRLASLGSSLERTVYLNSKVRDETGFDASADMAAARATDAANAVAARGTPRPRMRRDYSLYQLRLLKASDLFPAASISFVRRSRSRSQL